MGANMKKILALVFLAILLSGCASTPKLYKVESVYVCAAEECGQAAQRYGAEQMLAGLQQLLAANEGQTLKFCESDPKTRVCMSEGACHYVQGGPFPGLGCMKSTTVIAPVFDSARKRIQFQSKSKGSFFGIPAYCVVHGASITVHSIDEIVWEDEPFYCNWMIVGNSQNTLSVAVESVDFDRGFIGGYWTHGAGGTGGGIGTGYGVLVLPKGMPRGENWLTIPAKK